MIKGVIKLEKLRKPNLPKKKDLVKYGKNSRSDEQGIQECFRL